MIGKVKVSNYRFVVQKIINEKFQLMVPGDPGKAGPSVPRPVEEDLKIAPGHVTLQYQLLVERIARGEIQSQHPATHTSVSYKIQNIFLHISVSGKIIGQQYGSWGSCGGGEMKYSESPSCNTHQCRFIKLNFIHYSIMKWKILYISIYYISYLETEYILTRSDLIEDKKIKRPTYQIVGNFQTVITWVFSSVKA